MRFSFDPEQLAVLEVVEEFAQKELIPFVDEMQEKDQLPEHFFEKAGETGLIGIAMPEEYGGLGMSHETLMAALAAIGKAAPAL